MKFKSRKDSFFTVIMSTIILVLCVLLCVSIFKDNHTTEDIIGIITIAASVLLIIWIIYGTNYEITKSSFKYKSGPIFGKIDIKAITKGKTM